MEPGTVENSNSYNHLHFCCGVVVVVAVIVSLSVHYHHYGHSDQFNWWSKVTHGLFGSEMQHTPLRDPTSAPYLDSFCGTTVHGILEENLGLQDAGKVDSSHFQLQAATGNKTCIWEMMNANVCRVGKCDYGVDSSAAEKSYLATKLFIFVANRWPTPLKTHGYIVLTV